MDVKEKYITQCKDADYFIPMSTIIENSFDNKDAFGTRFALVMITKGSGIAMLDNHSIPYIAPCVFCINEKEHFIVPKLDELEIQAVFFSPAIINSLLDFNNIRHLPSDVPFTLTQDINLLNSFLIRKDGFHGKFELGPVSDKKLISMLQVIHKLLAEQEINWPCKSRSYLFQTLFFLDNLFENNSFTNEAYFETFDDDFHEILLYIYHNYEEKISVQEITERFHISKSTLARMFRTNLNDTFLSYLNKLRISLASTMLRDTMLPISDIMYRVGFYDSAHFLRSFKKYAGLSPTTYREKYCWMK